MPGATGNTGAAGSGGGSEVQGITLAPWAISSSTPRTTASSLQFGTLAPNKSYQFMFVVTGRLATPNPNTYDIRMGLTILSSNPAVIPVSSVSSSFGYFIDDASSYSRASFAVVGTVTTSALDPNTTLYFLAKDGNGSSGSDAVTFTGTGIIQLIGTLM